MEITVEMLHQRKADLQEDMKQLQNNYHAIAGAIQDCDYWIKKLEETQEVDSGPVT